MVRLQVKLGPKGQVLIPKVLRDQFRLYAGQMAVIEETDRGVLITSDKNDILSELEEIRNSLDQKKSKEYVYDKKQLDKQYRIPRR